MTHDPLCPITPHPDWTECVHCELITRVRNDTLSRVRKRIEKVPYVAPKYRQQFTHIAGAELDSVRRDFLTAIDSIEFTT